MEYYWLLETRDGNIVEIPPSAVKTVQRRWDEKLPIHTTNGSIPHTEIKDFRQSSKPHGAQPLMEAAAAAFHEPIVNPDGSIACRWVKKHVSQRDWNKLYAGIPANRKLGDDRGMVVVAVFLPIHEIDTTVHSYCTEEEKKRLQH